jgi:hypothetical protein
MAPYTARAEVIVANYELFLCLSLSPCGKKLMSGRNDWHTNRINEVNICYKRLICSRDMESLRYVFIDKVINFYVVTPGGEGCRVHK